MNKFEDIKPGDTVYIQRHTWVREGFRVALQGQFWIPLKVDRVTTTQFVAEGHRFNKQHGRAVGDDNDFFAHRLGETPAQGIVVDEGEAFKTRELLVKRVESATRLLDRNVAISLLGLKGAELAQACDLLEAFHKILDGDHD